MAKKQSRFTAKTADKHTLYQLSVQDVVTEERFLERTFKRLRKRDAVHLREDFCGTALMCGEWVRRRAGRTSTGVDIDPAVLAWGKEHNIDPLGVEQKRVSLLCQDVRAPATRRFDLVLAFNFSYWIFRTRPEMVDYFRRVRKALVKDGLFFLDAYGGWEAQEPMTESRPIRGGFTYVWDQDKFDPITHEVENHIHFEFRDGSKMKNAFSYFWRYWSLPELRELLIEAGFADVVVFWDVSEDEDTDDYRPRKRAENQPGWLAYLVALV